MSARHPVPVDTHDKHIAILGKTGSGKSSLAKTIAENLLARGARACVIDPAAAWGGTATIFLLWSAFVIYVAGQLSRPP